MIPTVLAQLVAEQSNLPEAPIVGAAGPGTVEVDGRRMVNMASNDYLGFARDPRVLAASHAALDRWGLGTAAGRVLSGNTAPHRELERALADWIGTSEAVLFGSCWTANAAIFGALASLATEASTTLAVYSDRLNHASIIDAIRAQRPVIGHLGVFDHNDHLKGLEDHLASQPGEAVKVIVTDGVFSMEGTQAPLTQLIELAANFDALLIVDDSHGTGVVGGTGRGTAEAQGVFGRVDIVTGTLGKALGGAIGGFVAGPARLMRLLRSSARPYVFSNNPPLVVIADALAALDILGHDHEPRTALRIMVKRLRDGIERLGLRSVPGDHPIVPIIFGNDELAQSASAQLAEAGVFASALRFPIVPRGEARLRLQVSAVHTEAAIDRVLNALH